MAGRPEEKPAPPEDDLFGPPAARAYALLSLAALLVVALLMSQDRLGWWNLVPVLVGVIAVLARWTFGPPLFLFLLPFLLLTRIWGLPPRFRAASPLLPDLALACAVLTYVVAHSRLLFLRRASRPPRPGALARETLLGELEGSAGQRFLPAPRAGRTPGGVSPAEVGVLLAAVPLFVAVGLLTWLRLAVESPFSEVGLRPAQGVALLLVWIMGASLATTAAVLGYLGWTQATPEEALQYLQDQLWRETRGEQRRLNRWLVWARLRRRRKEGA